MNPEPQSQATDWNLIRKLASPDCDESTWTEFYGLYHRLIYTVARRTGLGHDEAEDAVQTTMASLCRVLQEFQADPSRGRFRSWLMRIARRRIIDVLRDRPVSIPPSDPEASASGTTPGRPADPCSSDFDELWEEQWHAAVRQAAVERVRQQVSPEKFQVFDFYVVREMPVSRVAKSLGIRAGSVYLTAHRIKRLVRREAAELAKRM